MSSTISHQPPKDDEEEDDEEQGEEFMFDDSTDEEKAQEDITSKCITPVCVPKNDSNEASGAVAADCTQPVKHPPPAGPESIVASIPTTDVPAAESPNEKTLLRSDESASSKVCVYLNEDPEKLVREYMDVDECAEMAKAEAVLGIVI